MTAPATAPSTLAEKLIARAAGRDRVRPGEIVTARVDLAMIHDSGGPRRVAPILRELGAGLWDPAKVVLVSDHFVPGDTEEGARILALTRAWARARRGDVPRRRGHLPCRPAPSGGICARACSRWAATAIRPPAGPSGPTCSASARPRWRACWPPGKSG